MNLLSSKKGFCGIGVYHAKHACNVGTLFRSAVAFGADYLFTVGRPYRRQAGDTPNATKNLPYYSYESLEEMLNGRPKDCRLVLVEIDDNAKDLKNFVHPRGAVYLLGNESGGIPQDLLRDNLVVKIPTRLCLNLAVAGSVVLYDRFSKLGA